MNWFGLFYIVFGGIYLIYSVINKEKVTYYFKKKYLLVVNKQEYFRWQLRASILNVGYLLFFGILIMIFQFSNVVLIAGLIPFHLINMAAVVIGEKRGYIENTLTSK